MKGTSKLESSCLWDK